MNEPAPGDSLHRLLHAYKRALREAYLRGGIELPIAHVRVLKGIGYLPTCTAQAIAKQMQRDKSQITRIVKDLRTAKLARSQADPKDARSRILTPTPDGRALLARIAQAERETAAHMVDNLPPEAVVEFVRLAEIMAANLNTRRNCR